MYKHLLVPVDGSKFSLKALDVAGGLAASIGAKLSVVTVSPPYPMIVTGDGYMLDLNTPSQWEASTTQNAEKIRTTVEKRAKARGLKVNFTAITTDNPYEGIIKTAVKKKCDLIVMASHGRRGLSAILLGSETTKVLTHTKLPVLVCR
ncbi:MAG TPA: universal stress protein [Usitatibacteraceae bacterium]